MKVEQIYTGCLAQGTYYIVSNGEAAIIDPLREVKPYLEKLEQDGVKLKYIFETHFHADFVSGHIDLKDKTNAQIVYGPNANPEFEALIAKDNDLFEIGDIKIKVLHTPGHTMESSTYLLIDEQGKDYAIFSGDTLFLGDVGRPDLAQKAADLTKEDLAGFLYDSLMQKIMPLADDVIVYPAHGAGSACGKNMMKETVDTLGHQKEINYALKQPNKESFINAVLEGLQEPQAYFGMNVAMNKQGYQSFDRVLQKGLQPLSAKEFEALANTSNAVILDTRNSNDFAKGFIPQSVNIGIDGDFAPWVGAMLLDVQQPILLVCDELREEEVITRLARVGFDHVIGYLKGGINAWQNEGFEIDQVNRITADDFSANVNVEKDIVIDVRKESEYAAEHVDKAYSKPLAKLNHWIQEINPSEHFYLHCAGGYRSMIAASILQARGYRNFSEVDGGYNAIKKTAVAKSNFVCQSKTI